MSGLYTITLWGGVALAALEKIIKIRVKRLFLIDKCRNIKAADLQLNVGLIPNS